MTVDTLAATQASKCKEVTPLDSGKDSLEKSGEDDEKYGFGDESITATGYFKLLLYDVTTLTCPCQTLSSSADDDSGFLYLLVNQSAPRRDT